MSKYFQASLVENRCLAEHHYLLTLRPDLAIRNPRPGQFFMLSVSNGLDPLLKRPFSVHGWRNGALQFLYKVVGRGTDLLSRQSSGTKLDVIGPLGNGFPSIRGAQQFILVAGGLGIAPLFPLAEKLKKRRPIIFYGARTKHELLRHKDLASLGLDVTTATDDGSAGRKGVVTDMVEQFMTRHKQDPGNIVVYACGPRNMLRELARLSHKYQTRTYTAMEQYMACGVGTCLGCVVKTGGGFRRVCREGPVFPIDEIIWD